MKLTAKGQCALRAMVELALNEKNRISVKEIAKRQELSVRYLEQVFAALKKEKLVNGTKGPSGGYTLEKQPKDTSIASIIFAVEGRNPFNHMSSVDALGQTFDDIFSKLDQEIEEYLGGLTLKMVVESYKEKSDNQYMYFI